MSNLLVIDGAGVPRTVKTTDTAGVQTPHQNVDALPTGVATDINLTRVATQATATSLAAQAAFLDGLEALLAATNAALATLDGHVDALEGYTDNLETLTTANTTAVTANGTALATLHADLAAVQTALTTLNANVDGLEGFTDNIEGLLTTLQTYVDGLEALVGSTNTALTSIAANQAAPAAVYNGKTTVTTAGVRVVLGSSQALTEGVSLRGIDTNTQLVYTGNSAMVAASADRVAAKERAFIRANNVNLVYLDAVVNGEGVTWTAW